VSILSGTPAFGINVIALSIQEEPVQATTQVKTTPKLKKISVRRTADVRLTAALCNVPYYVNA
jgi:hypothetical protein